MVLPVSDVDRAKRFYEGLGWRLDADICPTEDFRVVQLTPPGGSACSIQFGLGISSAAPGSAQSLYVAVADIGRRAGTDRSWRERERGVFTKGCRASFRASDHAAGPVASPRQYSSYATFEDPDGNGWLLQEITERLPGREWSEDEPVDVPRLAELLKETGLHHDAFEKSHEPHDWWDWYAPSSGRARARRGLAGGQERRGPLCGGRPQDQAAPELTAGPSRRRSTLL